MCTPVGHSLSGVTIYYILNANKIRVEGKVEPRKLFLYIMLSNLPDIDFIPGIISGNPNMYHHIVSHSILFLLLISLLLSFLVKIHKNKTSNFGIIALLLLSHTIIDFFTEDTSLPRGIDLFWPYQRYFISPYIIFPTFRRNLSHILSVDNLYTLFIESSLFLLLWGLFFCLLKVLGNKKSENTS
jgi:inner membrane protein